MIPQLGSTYDYDDIGNGKTSTSPLLGDHTYGPTNQYSTVTTGNKRTAAGRAPIGGTVEVAGTNATRTGEIYHRELTGSNASGPVWQSVITKSVTPEPDFLQTNRFWYAKASVTPAYVMET